MNVPDLPLLVMALGVGAALFAWFVSLERAGKSLTVVLFVFAVLLTDSLVFWTQNEVPTGIFHPTLAGVTFRLEDVIIPLALGARLFASTSRQGLGFTALAWGAFLAWIVTAAVQGLLSGHDFALITFEGKVVIYLGAMALAAGVPADQYVRVLRRAAPYLSGLTLLALAAASLKIAISGSLFPGVTLNDFGVLGSDAATILAGIAVLLVAIAMCSRDRRLPMLLASAPLMAATLIAEQRAALLGLGISLLTLVLLGALRGRHIKVTPTELGLASLLVAAFFVLPPGTKAALGSSDKPTLPFAASLETTFTSRGKQLSAEERVNQYEQVTALIAERPVLGWGLGKTYVYYQVGYYQFYRTNLSHNIVSDLLMRAGVVGLALFVLAVALTLASGGSVWLRHPDAAVAALALGATANVAGLLSKGLVESIFEKYRLAIFLGLMIGVLGSAFRSLRESAQDERRQPAIA